MRLGPVHRIAIGGPSQLRRRGVSSAGSKNMLCPPPPSNIETLGGRWSTIPRARPLAGGEASECRSRIRRVARRRSDQLAPVSISRVARGGVCQSLRVTPGDAGVPLKKGLRGFGLDFVAPGFLRGRPIAAGQFLQGTSCGRAGTPEKCLRGTPWGRPSHTSPRWRCPEAAAENRPCPCHRGAPVSLCSAFGYGLLCRRGGMFDVIWIDLPLSRAALPPDK